MYEHNGAFMATSHVGGIMPYNCILICFDLCGNTGKNPREYDFSTPQPYQPYYRNPVLDTIPSVFHPGDDGIRLLFETILRLHVSDGDSARLQEKSCMLQLLNRLYLAAHFPAGGDGDNNADPDGRIRQMMMYIQSHLAEPLSLDTLASMAGLSPAHFHKIFTRVVREPLNAYVTRLRMEKHEGCLLEQICLLTRSVPIADIQIPPISAGCFANGTASLPEHTKGCTATHEIVTVPGTAIKLQYVTRMFRYLVPSYALTSIVKRIRLKVEPGSKI